MTVSLPRLRVGIVDDEETIRRSLSKLFNASGHDVATAADGVEAIAMAEERGFDIFLLDLVMPQLGGIEVLRRLKQLQPHAAVIMMSAHGDVANAVEAMKLGAENFVTKPVDMQRLLALVITAGKWVCAERDARHLRQLQPGRRSFVGVSEHAREVLRFAELMADNPDTTALLSGESGTGKGVLASLIHHRSPRAERPMTEINCAELSATLLESELFGHERGAFTDARERKEGLVEVAQGGTLFLDEIGELDASVQPKLLKFLESRTYRRLGSTQDRSADVRVVAATNADLAQRVERGTFRRDLYYRLKVMPFELRPLRERPEDIPPLCEHFITSERGLIGRRLERIDSLALQHLQAHHWPGNVRELHNVIERAAILAPGDEITCADLPQEITHRAAVTPAANLGTLEAMERRLVAETLEACDGNRSHAAKSLGVTRSTLLRKLKRFGLG